MEEGGPFLVYYFLDHEQPMKPKKSPRVQVMPVDDSNRVKMRFPPSTRYPIAEFEHKQQRQCSAEATVLVTMASIMVIAIVLFLLAMTIIYWKKKYRPSWRSRVQPATLSPEEHQFPNDYRITEAVKFYADECGVLGCTDQYFLDEYRRWQDRFRGMNESHKPKTCCEALEFLLKIGQDWFPNVYTLLKILATLPVTSVDVERAFSTLRRLKTYLRNTMSDERMNGLAMLNIHRNINVEIETVIDNFAKVSRRLALK